jgi:hypothetical protein
MVEDDEDVAADEDAEVHRLAGIRRQLLQLGQRGREPEALFGDTAEDDENGTELVAVGSGVLAQQAGVAEDAGEAVSGADGQTGRVRDVGHAEIGGGVLEGSQHRQRALHGLCP